MVHQNSSRRQLTYQMKTSLVEQIKKNPHQTTKDLQKFFYDTYNWEICQTTLSCILKKEGLGIKKSTIKPRSNPSFDLTCSIPDQQKLPSYPNQSNLSSPQQIDQSYLHPYLPSNLSPPHDNLHHSLSTDISNPIITSNSPNLGLINMPSTSSSSTTTSSSSPPPSVLPPIQMSQDTLVQFQQIPLNQLNQSINQIPHYTYHTPSPIDSSFSSTDDSLKSGYKIYNTNILCNDDSNQVLSVVHPNIHNISALQTIHSIPNIPFNYSGLNPTFTSFAQIHPSSTSPSLSSSPPPPPPSSFSKQQVPPPHTISTAPATPPSDNDSSVSPPSNNYNYHPRSQLYDINIINPHVKRFRPSSQYQQLEKIVLKLACDLHRDHKSKMNDFKLGHQHHFDPTYPYQNPTLSPPMTYTYPNDPAMDTNPAATSFVSSPQTLSNSEIVKRIKKEISTSPQYHSIPKPIYLNQFIHKCLRRYQFTDELIDRLSNVNPMTM